MKHEIPKSPLKRLMKKYGCEMVSSRAIERFREILEEDIIKNISKDISKVTQHAGRKIVREEDVEIALDVGSKPL